MPVEFCLLSSRRGKTLECPVICPFFPMAGIVQRLVESGEEEALKNGRKLKDKEPTSLDKVVVATNIANALRLWGFDPTKCKKVESGEIALGGTG